MEASSSGTPAKIPRHPSPKEASNHPMTRSVSRMRSSKNSNGSDVTDLGPHVFLGGSCNPTSWRSDMAIPLLKDSGVTYYNPQVDDWKPSMLEDEAQAIRHAHVLLFVIDIQTRATSSVVEAVGYICAGRRVVLVSSYFSEGARILGTELAADEIADLNRIRVFMMDVAQRFETPVFSTVESAIVYVIQTYKNFGGKFPEVLKMSSSDSNAVTNNDQVVMVKYDNESPHSGVTNESLRHKGRQDMCHSSRWSGSRDGTTNDDDNVLDVFLGGSCGLTDWRSTIVIPKLRSRGLLFFDPQVDCWCPELMSIENKMKARAKCLLYIILNQTRSLLSLVESAEAICHGLPTVLYIEDLTEDSVVNGRRLGMKELSDLRRARLYVADIARRNGVKLVLTIEKAVDEVLKMVQPSLVSESDGRLVMQGIIERYNIRRECVKEIEGGWTFEQSAFAQERLEEYSWLVTLQNGQSLNGSVQSVEGLPISASSLIDETDANNSAAFSPRALSGNQSPPVIYGVTHGRPAASDVRGMGFARNFQLPTSVLMHDNGTTEAVPIVSLCPDIRVPNDAITETVNTS